MVNINISKTSSRLALLILLCWQIAVPLSASNPVGSTLGSVAINGGRHAYTASVSVSAAHVAANGAALTPACGTAPTVVASATNPSCVDGANGVISASAVVGLPPFPAFEYELRNAIDNSVIVPFGANSVFAGLGGGNYIVRAKEVGCPNVPGNVGEAVVNLSAPSAAFVSSHNSVTSSSAVVVWSAVNPVTNVASYSLRYRVLGSSTWTTITGISSTSVNRTLSGLQNNTTYEVQVASVCTQNGTVSSFQPVVPYTFTTQAQVATCLTPGGVYVSEEAFTTSRLTWSPVSSATCYLVSWGVTGSSPTTWPEISVTPINGNLTTQTTTIASLSPNTNYQVRVRSVCGGGCTGATRSAFSPLIPFRTLSCPANITINNGATTLTACGSTTLNINNAITGTGITYTWFLNGNPIPGQTTPSLFVSTSGNYTAQLNIVGCGGTISSTNTVAVNVVTAINALTTSTNINCRGASAGTASVTPNNGTAPYSFLWSNGATTSTITGLAAGTYTATVTDANGCTGSSTITVTEPALAFTANATTTQNVLCLGNSTGAINLTTSNGVGVLSYAWSNGANTQNISGIPAGTYTVTATDGNGCVALASATVTQPATSVTVGVTGTNVNCISTSTGTATASGSGGTGAISYLWSNGATTAAITGLAAGTYSVTARDANNCTATGSITITQPSAGITITLNSLNNVACHGNATGAINITATPGTGSVSYLWSNGATTAAISGLAANTYTVTVTDGAPCTRTQVFVVTQPMAPLTNSFTGADVTCHGLTNGTLTAVPAGGTTPYTYLWNNAATTATINNLGVGNYTVTVTDANGCQVVGTDDITQPAALTITPTVTNATCFQTATGGASAGVSGGISPYTYAWSTGATTAAITGLVAGAYSVTVTDANGCQSNVSVTVTQPATNPLMVSITATNVTCFNGTNGSASTMVSGSMGTLTYAWSNGASTANISSLVPNTYTVTVSDAGNSCTRSATAVITQPAGMTITLTGVSPSCGLAPNNNNGTITTGVSGGTTPYAYNWGGSITTQNRNSLVGGTYTVTVTDANGCTSTSSVTLTNPPALNNPALTITNVRCRNEMTGALATNVSGGTTPYTYAWATGQTTASVSGLMAGAYVVTVTDAKGCTSTQAATITQPAADLVVSIITVTNVTSCSNGTGGLVAEATGTSGFAYAWNNGATTAAATGLTATPSGTTYTVSVTDANGCVKTASATITAPAVNLSLSVTSVQNVRCNTPTTLAQAGSALVTIVGGRAPYVLSPSAVTPAPSLGGTVTPTLPQSAYTGNTISITGLTAQIYTVSVTDTDGCTANVNIVVTQPGALTVTASKVDPSCIGGDNGSINLTVTGGTPIYNYNWSNGATIRDLIELTTGTYQVTVTDNNGCTSNISVTLNNPPTSVNVVNIASTNVTCFGANNGSAMVTAAGGYPPYTYLWTNGATTASATGLVGTFAGTPYTVSVTDSRGCVAVGSVNIHGPRQALSITSIMVMHATCAGRADGGAQVNMPLSPFTTSSNMACTATQTINTERNVAGTPFCVAPYYMFMWNNGNTQHTITGVTAGNYTVTVTDANGCTVVGNTTIGTINQVTATIASQTNVTCRGAMTGAVNVTVANGTPAYTFNWTNGAITKDLTGLSAGTYTLTVSDFWACTNTLMVTITEPASGVTVSLTTTAPRCAPNDGDINTIVTGGTAPYTYAWSGAPGVLTPNRTGLTGGTYTVTVTETGGCTTTAQVTFANGPTAPLAAPTWAARTTALEVTCFGLTDGDVATSTNMITGGTPFSGNTLNYAWSNGVSGQFTAGGMLPASMNAFAAGTFTVTITDANGCTVTGMQVVTQPAAALMVSVSSVTNVTCRNGHNGQINLSVTGGSASYNYTWASVGGVAAMNALPITTPPALGIVNNPMNLTAGTYTVTITDQRGCTASVSATITQPATGVSVSLTTTNPRCAMNDGAISSMVTGGTGTYLYDWGGGIYTANRTMLMAGTYIVTVTDGAGCTATAQATLTGGAAALVAPTWAPRTAALEVTCRGTQTGDVAASSNNITGGTAFTGGILQYHWSNGQNGQFAQGAHLPALTNAFVAGTFTVTITDANGCTVTGTQVITEPAAALSVSITGTTNITCTGTSTGSLTSLAANGTPLYTYAWSNGGNMNMISGIAAGTYTVTVTDDRGCTSTAAGTVTQPTTPALTVSLTTSFGPCGTAGSNLNAIITGGTSPVTVNWSDIGSGPVNRTGVNTTMSAVTYTVTVTDNNGCTTTASISVPANTVSPLTIAAISGIKNVSCFGGNDGWIGAASVNGAACSEIATFVSGGTRFTGNIYNFIWSNGVSGTTSTATGTCSDPNRQYFIGRLNNVTAGTYTVTVTDAQGCTASRAYTVAQPSSLLNVTTAAAVGPTCGSGTGSDNGFINVSVSGGTTPYSFNWNSGTFFTQNITGLTAGTYNLTVTDGTGCTRTLIVGLTAPSALTGGSYTITNVTCHGGMNGAVSVSGMSGGVMPYIVQWYAGQNPSGPVIGTSATLSNLTAGDYNVVVTDVNGCTARPTGNFATVTQPATPLAIDDNFCANPNPTTCTGATNSRHVACHGGNTGWATATVTGFMGNIMYSWSTGRIVTQTATTDRISGLVAGTYTVTVIDQNGCSMSRVYTITQPALALTATSNATNVTCPNNTTPNAANGSITVFPAGGTTPYSYAWTGSMSTTATAANLDGTTAGTVYTATITDANGCTVTVTRTITRPANIALPPQDSAVINASCDGVNDGEIKLSNSPVIKGGTTPYTYLWSANANGATSQNVAGLYGGYVGSPEHYTVTVTDANGCSLTQSYAVTQPYPIEIYITSTPANHQVGCPTSRTGFITYTVGFDTDANNLADSPVGTAAQSYTVFLYANGNQVGNTSIAAHITQPTMPAAFGVGTTAGRIENLGVGSYQLLVMGPNGCTGTISQDITLSTTPFSIAFHATVPDQTFGNTSGMTNPAAAFVNNVSGCKGASNGDIAFHLQGPFANGVTLAWNTGVFHQTSMASPNALYNYVNGIGSNPTAPTMSTFAGLPAGTYTVTIYDSGNAATYTTACSQTYTFTIQDASREFQFYSTGTGALDNNQINSTAFRVELVGSGTANFLWGYDVEFRPTTSPSLNARWERVRVETAHDGSSDAAGALAGHVQINTLPNLFTVPFGDNNITMGQAYIMGRTNLTAGVNYQFRMRTICNGIPGPWSAIVTHVSDLQAATLSAAGDATGNACGFVRNIRATSVAASSAVLRWDVPTGTTQTANVNESYIVGIRPTGSTGAFVNRPCVGTNFLNVTGLLPGTTYDVQILSRCQNGGLGTGNCAATTPNINATTAGNNNTREKVSYAVFTTLTARDAQQPTQEVAAAEATQFTVYPNPSRGDFRITYSATEAGKVSVKVTDLLGKVVYNSTTNATIGVNEIPVKVEGYNSGIYLVQVQQGSTVRTAKVVMN